jgi:hypothetical protein
MSSQVSVTTKQSKDHPNPHLGLNNSIEPGSSTEPDTDTQERTGKIHIPDGTDSPDPFPELRFDVTASGKKLHLEIAEGMPTGAQLNNRGLDTDLSLYCRMDEMGSWIWHLPRSDEDELSIVPVASIPGAVREKLRQHLSEDLCRTIEDLLVAALSSKRPQTKSTEKVVSEQVIANSIMYKKVEGALQKLIPRTPGNSGRLASRQKARSRHKPINGGATRVISGRIDKPSTPRENA